MYGMMEVFAGKKIQGSVVSYILQIKCTAWERLITSCLRDRFLKGQGLSNVDGVGRR